MSMMSFTNYMYACSKTIYYNNYLYLSRRLTESVQSHVSIGAKRASGELDGSTRKKTTTEINRHEEKKKKEKKIDTNW